MDNLIKQEEGLPNINGGFYCAAKPRSTGTFGYILYSASGAFTFTRGTGPSYATCDTESAQKTDTVTFSASDSNSIYGNSQHVTPENLTYCLWKRIA